MKSKCNRKGCYEPADCRHGYCAAHCSQRHRLRDYSERKMPRGMEPHVGVEIEVEFADEHSFKRGVPLGGHGDGSLGAYGAEYKVLATAKKIDRKAGKLLEELWSRRAKVTNRCGLHVHLDVRYINRARMCQLFDWLKDTEDVWFSLVPPSRRNNDYVRRFDVDEYPPAPDQGRRDSVCRPSTGIPIGHYDWVHRTPYNTVEFRLHGSTLNAWKLSGWLAALIHVQSKLRDVAYEFPTVDTVYPGYYEGMSEQEYLSATERSDREAKKACFLALFQDAPQEGKEYLEARLANGGILRDVARQTVEA